MEDNNLKNQFSADLLGAVSKVLGESPRAYDQASWKNPGHKEYADAIDHAVKQHSHFSVSDADKEKFHGNAPTHSAGRDLHIPAVHKKTGEKHTIIARIYNQGGKHPYEILDSNVYRNSVKEEAEQIDELKTSTLKSYRSKAREDKGDAEDEREFYKAHNDQKEVKRQTKRRNKRVDGINMANDKMNGGARSTVKIRSVGEEAEQIDELKASTVRSLLDKRKNAMGPETKEKKEKHRKSGWLAFAKLHKQPHAKVHATEEVSLDEKHGGADYALYHKSYTDAVDHALSHHGKSGLSVSDDDRFHHIGLMSKKPSEGNTTTLNLPAKDHATGKDHTIHMQVFNRGGSNPYELNTYSSKNSTQRQIDRATAKRKKALGEELIGGQAKLDVDKDGKIEKSDFKKLRNKKIAAKMKDKDCTCDDDADEIDEVYGGARVTLKPYANVRSGGLDKHHQDALTAKLREYDAKMDAAKKKFATKEEVELEEAKFKAPHDDSFVQSVHPRTGPEAKFYHKNGMMWHGREGGYNTWRIRFGDREKGDLDKGSNDHPKRYRSMERAKAALIAGKPVKEEVELSEVSAKLLKNKYMSKARSDRDSAWANDYRYSDLTGNPNDSDEEQDAKDDRRAEKREKGIALARAKTNKSGKSGSTIAKVKANEEVEIKKRRGRPTKVGSAAYIAQQKAKEAGEAEGPEPDEHIMNQVRKAADSGMMPHKIKYADGSTHSLHRVHARAVIAKYNRLKPFAKEDMQAEIAKSHEHMMKHAKD